MRTLKFILFIYLIFNLTYNASSQDTATTYKVGLTEYYQYQFYSTTGLPRVKRSETNKKLFLESQGLKETPEGYEIDHIIPLSQGGSDHPSNMQLLTIEQHARKTALERSYKINVSYDKAPAYNSSSTYDELPTYRSSPTNTPSPSYYSTPSNSNDRQIQTGPRGGQYYINSNGNKTYIKK